MQFFLLVYLLKYLFTSGRWSKLGLQLVIMAVKVFFSTDTELVRIVSIRIKLHSVVYSYADACRIITMTQ